MRVRETLLDLRQDLLALERESGRQLSSRVELDREVQVLDAEIEAMRARIMEVDRPSAGKTEL